MVTMRKQLVGDTSMKFGRANPKRFLTIHETGNTGVGANAAAHANLQSRHWEWATWHWTVDAKEAVQSFTHDFQLWHAGDGTGNGNMQSIGMEICVNSDMNRATARQKAAELAAHILKTEGIPIGNMVQHNYWSGKNCPSFIRGEGRWNEFVALVQKAMGGKPGPAPKPDPKPGKKTIGQLADEVYRGDWGNDPQRSQRLRDAGYDPNAVQAEVNRKYFGGGGTPPPANSGKKSVGQLAEEVWLGHWGNDPQRSASLRALGYDAAAVQAEVNRRYGGGGGGSAPSGGGNLAAIAAEVYAGAWGNDPERSQRLRAAGHDPVAVQNEVNRRYYGGGGAAPAAPSKKSNAQIAREIAFGEGHGGRNPWGNDPERSAKLRAAGYDPAAVQAEVNKLF